MTHGEPCTIIPYSPLHVPPITDRPVLLLATATITADNLFANGLFQNVFALYRMLDSMGYAPILIVNEKPTSLEKIPASLRKCRMITTNDMLKQRIERLTGLVEIGMSLDASVRRFIKQLGGRVWKLYLGNILNIDIETPIFYPTHFFPHHIVGDIDAIWISPHYAQHSQYASYINHVKPPAALEDMIAPYIWDPSFVEGIEWSGGESATAPIVIMEPNISFQKTAFVPLLIAEAYARAHPEWTGRVIVVNGDRLQEVPHFVENVQPYLDLASRIDFQPRQDIKTVLQLHPSATFILHNVNNEFNYMTLELLYTGFPVLHNSPSWSAFGYYYAGSSISDGVKRLEEAVSHAERKETYRAHAQTLAWRYSPYNPATQIAWKRLLSK